MAGSLKNGSLPWTHSGVSTKRRHHTCIYSFLLFVCSVQSMLYGLRITSATKYIQYYNTWLQVLTRPEICEEIEMILGSQSFSSLEGPVI